MCAFYAYLHQHHSIEHQHTSIQPLTTQYPHPIHTQQAAKFSSTQHSSPVTTSAADTRRKARQAQKNSTLNGLGFVLPSVQQPVRRTSNGTRNSKQVRTYQALVEQQQQQYQHHYHQYQYQQQQQQQMSQLPPVPQQGLQLGQGLSMMDLEAVFDSIDQADGRGLDAFLREEDMLGLGNAAAVTVAAPPSGAANQDSSMDSNRPSQPEQKKGGEESNEQVGLEWLVRRDEKGEEEKRKRIGACGMAWALCGCLDRISLSLFYSLSLSLSRVHTHSFFHSLCVPLSLPGECCSSFSANITQLTEQHTHRYSAGNENRCLKLHMSDGESRNTPLASV